MNTTIPHMKKGACTDSASNATPPRRGPTTSPRLLDAENMPMTFPRFSFVVKLVTNAFMDGSIMPSPTARATDGNRTVVKLLANDMKTVNMLIYQNPALNSMQKSSKKI